MAISWGDKLNRALEDIEWEAGSRIRFTPSPQFRAWYYGPNGEAQIFTDAADIPAGWADAPGKVPAHPLDRDGNGNAGGSLKGQRRKRKA